ncbi:cell division protein SepF, partial [Streptomyces albidoflavus]
MAGAMRKMAVYLGLVEDDGYDGPGFDPDDEFEPEPEPERDRRRHAPAHQEQAEEPVRAPQPPAQREREPVPLPAESGRPARIAPVASITPERQSLEKNAPVIMPKVVSEREPYRITTLHP